MNAYLVLTVSKVAYICCSCQCRGLPFGLRAYFRTCRFQEESGIALRFVIGHSDDPWEETHLQEEIDEHGGFLRLPITVRGPMSAWFLSCASLQTWNSWRSAWQTFFWWSTFAAPLKMQEGYYSLTNKILVYLRQVSAIYDAEYVIKSDDDVYFRLDRLPHSIKQWQEIGAGMPWRCLLHFPRYLLATIACFSRCSVPCQASFLWQRAAYQK